MTGFELKQDLLRKVGATDPTKVPASEHHEAATAVTKAFQQMWTAPGGEFFRRVTKTVNTVAGTDTYTLDADVQTVIGPVVVQGTPLREVVNRANFVKYNDRFQSSLAPSGTPCVYFIDRKRLAAEEAAQVNLKLWPNPNAALVVEVDVETEAPKYDACDLEEGSGRLLEVPHKYVELYLLPIARYEYASSSSWHNGQTQLAALKEARDEARATLGFTEPSEARRES